LAHRIGFKDNVWAFLLFHVPHSSDFPLKREWGCPFGTAPTLIQGR